jgi:DNA-binding LacI/PurR family transcriptional regulator
VAKDIVMPKWSKNKTRVGKVAQILESRIHHGDYLLKEIPAERELAKEVGVSRETVRKAVSGLIERGLLKREANGRILASESTESNHRVRRIAFLSNSFPSPYSERWHRAILQMTQKRGWTCRHVAFAHQNDPLIEQTINSFDGTFLMPGGPLDEHVIQLLEQAQRPLVILDSDYSARKLASIWLSSPLFIRCLFDYLYDMGHRQVACLNTQQLSPVIETWIGQWEQWKLMNHCDGPLINDAVAAYELTEDRAYEVVLERIKRNTLDCTAMFCTTGVMAMAAMRAIHDCGLIVGKDISVCAASSHAGQARYMIPRLTCLMDVNPANYLDVCLDWFDRDTDQWVGPYLLEPHEPCLFKGESVGRVTTGVIKK